MSYEGFTCSIENAFNKIDMNGFKSDLFLLSQPIRSNGNAFQMCSLVGPAVSFTEGRT